MTIEEFQKDIQTRVCRYASLGEADKDLPVHAIIHISDVGSVATYPGIIWFSDGVNIMTLSQIQSIELEGDHYNIVCGVYEAMRACVVVHFCDSSS